jgi:hypothetical protein
MANVDCSSQGHSIDQLQRRLRVSLSAPDKALCVRFAATSIYQTPDCDEGKRLSSGAASPFPYFKF